MIGRTKDWAKRHWPQLRLRTILMLTLLFAAGLPGVGAISLRVYENTLVRQTEAELVAQGAALAAAAVALWPNAPPLVTPRGYRPETAFMDLSASPVLPERPAPGRAATPADPAALILAARLAPIAFRTARTTLASIQLLDRSGTVVMGAEAGGGHPRLPEFRRAIRGSPATLFRRNAGYAPVYSFEWLSRASALRIHHARPVIVGGRPVAVLLLSRSPRALFKGLYQDRGKILLGIALIFGALLVVAALLSRGIARPVEQLGAATRRLAAGEPGDVPEAPATAAIEIRALFADFAAMAAAVDRRGRYLRDFAAAVSHEFKTPLAGIRGGIELLEDHGAAMSDADRRRFLGNIAADADRLSQLVGRLLDLARADMAPRDAGASSDPAAALARVADAWSGFVVVDTGPLPHVAVPQPALEAVLTALFENSRQAGATRVAVTAHAGADTLALRVDDDGPGVPPGDAPRLFEPFFTSRRATGGTGLGLPIARSLLHASGGELALADVDQGATFVVTLPLAGRPI